MIEYSFKCCKRKQVSQINQYFMAIIVSIPTFCVGMLFGWISPAIPHLLAVENNPLGRPMSSSEIPWLASSVLIAALPCMGVAGYMADTVGRKIALLVTSFSLIACWIIKIAFIRNNAILIARAISGIADAGSYVVAPVYINEISDPEIRGALGSMLMLLQNGGFLFMYIISDLVSFNAVLWISLSIPLFHFGVHIFLPDSPPFLIKKGKIQEATQVLAWLRSVDENDKNVLEDISKLEKENKVHKEDNKGAWKVLLKDKIALQAFGIVVVLQLAQELCGDTVIFTFASIVFEQTNFQYVLTPNHQAVILSVVQLIGSVMSIVLVEKVGRKILLAGSSCAAGVGMFALGGWFYLKSLGTIYPGWIPLVALVLSIFFATVGFQPIPYILMAEMFNFRLRGFVSSVAITLITIGDIGQTQAYQPLNASIGYHGTFWLFAAISFLGCLFTIAFLPETKGKPLEKIYDDLQNRKWFKRKGQLGLTHL